MELSKSLADDIEESWNTERVLGDEAEPAEEREGQGEAPPPSREGDIEEVRKRK